MGDGGCNIYWGFQGQQATWYTHNLWRSTHRPAAQVRDRFCSSIQVTGRRESTQLRHLPRVKRLTQMHHHWSHNGVAARHTQSAPSKTYGTSCRQSILILNHSSMSQDLK